MTYENDETTPRRPRGRHALWCYLRDPIVWERCLGITRQIARLLSLIIGDYSGGD